VQARKTSIKERFLLNLLVCLSLCENSLCCLIT